MFAEAFMKKEVLKALNYKDLRSDVFFLLFLKIFSYNTHLFTDFILIQPAMCGLFFLPICEKRQKFTHKYTLKFDN